MKRKTYRTTRDIVIPAGTEIGAPPTSSSRWKSDWEGCVALDSDHTGNFTLSLEDGIELGLVAEDAPGVAYPESFANQPVSILEERANRAKGGADVWTVRDALLAALRDLDSGKNMPEGFVVDEIQIIMVATGPEKDTAFRYYRRVKSLLSGLGILDTARFDTHREAQG
jgi:hypothetical protein